MTPQSGHLELVNAERTDPGSSLKQAPMTMEADPNKLSADAAELARGLAWIPGQPESWYFRERYKALLRAFTPVLTMLQAREEEALPEELLRLRENVFLLEGEQQEGCETFASDHRLPQVRTLEGTVVPRIGALAQNFLAAVSYRFTEASFTSYLQAFQDVTVLKMAELWMLIPVMKLVLLEQIAERGRRLLLDSAAPHGVGDPLRSLQEIKQTSWKSVIEPLILFDRVLREDPAGAYPMMDYETREAYRRRVAEVAARCDCSEINVAEEALALARQGKGRQNENPRVTLRDSHVGTYLLAERSPALRHRVGFRPTIPQRWQDFLLSHPDEFYLPGIAALTFAIIWAVVLLLTPPTTSLWLILLAILAVLLPSSQSAVQIMNYLATLLVPAQTLPKLEFDEGLPGDCVTMVAVPAVLMDEKQVHRLVDDLEVRYLGNQDPNIHFALLSDLPDSPAHPREEKCSDRSRFRADPWTERTIRRCRGRFFLSVPPPSRV